MQDIVPGQVSLGAPEAPLFLMDCEATNPQGPAPSPPPLPPAPDGGAAPEDTDGPPAVDVIPVRSPPWSCEGWGGGGAAQTLSVPRSRSRVWLQFGQKGLVTLVLGMGMGTLCLAPARDWDSEIMRHQRLNILGSSLSWSWVVGVPH